ncbi:metallophosphoesterase [Nocardia aurantiaca]|uniref:Metallophosphatase n=1 Tax=Nocardia aurantiaca TaxID=2675850 RepID=A0A6I3L1Q7_9NOCA|nr:metallophosphoesterase [Nocardia aurantiaca]MTE14565.1 metallophosphatase [Nocardia aurantiaca]
MTDLTLVQLTDTHLRAAGEPVLDTVDTFTALAGVLDRLRTGGRRIGALILSGDLADNGAPEAYRRLRGVVEPAAAELGAQVLYVMGNHDERTAFGVELLGLEPGSADCARPHDRVLEVDGLRLIGMDSTTPGRHNGRLEPEQLAWLGEQLRRPAARGTVLVLHHPPLPSAIPAAEFLKLEDADRLAEVVAGTDVRMILCGHNHMTAASALAGIPVWVGPALAYRIDAMAPAGRQQGFVGSGFTRLDVLGSTVIATAVEAAPGTRIYDKADTEVQQRLAALAAEAG